MSNYDRIARRWETVTGHDGGPFKQVALNDILLARIGRLSDRRVLEIGAGNGYLIRLAARRLGGSEAQRIVVTDASKRLLDLACRHRRIPYAEYQVLDVRSPFPFHDGAFDRVIAVMLFNELTDGALTRALGETWRVLEPGGRLVGAVLHPALVASLDRRGELRDGPPVTMPGPSGLRLPVVRRDRAKYEKMFEAAGFEVTFEDVKAPPSVRRAKPGLARAGSIPVALVVDASRVQR